MEYDIEKTGRIGRCLAAWCIGAMIAAPAIFANFETGDSPRAIIGFIPDERRGLSSPQDDASMIDDWRACDRDRGITTPNTGGAPIIAGAQCPQ